MTAEAPVAEAVPLATLMSVNVRTWLEQAPNGEPIPCLMITYPAPQFDDADPAVVEATMRQVAQSLGAVPAGEPVPDVGTRLTLGGGVALLWFLETGYALKVQHPRWVRGLEQCGGALLAVGLDELSQVASVAEVDEYRNHSREAGRLQFALARVGRAVGGAS
ncbi:hypothetical protein ACFWD7_37060 [Streptomyces mirabilis]|uniref:hypothetical protein n=1 Tax=Streptomyces TaxID=1883 RepID=UPI0029AA0810|nr:hypothetical protein [Streptomyces sp. AK08-02]MDX3753751.1 hypothetical protein [Streptomyces sp. AK08-02]